MRGLLVKDYHLTMKNKRLFLIFAGIGLLMILTGNNPSFLVSYISIVSAMMVLTTITYDEFDKSVSFLMTMPVTRRMYVQGKYVFGLLCTLVGWLISTLFVIVYQLLFGSSTPWNEIILPIFIFLYLAIMMLLLMIPIQIKFGGDNGKIVIMAFVVIVIVASTVLGKAGAYFHIDLSWLMHTTIFGNKLFLGILAVLLHLILITISYRCSVGIIQKKEF